MPKGKIQTAFQKTLFLQGRGGLIGVDQDVRVVPDEFRQDPGQKVGAEVDGDAELDAAGLQVA